MRTKTCIALLLATELLGAQDSRPLDPQTRPASRPAPPALAFTHVTVIDGTGRPALPDQTLVVAGGRIAALGPAAGVVVPGGVRVIEARGRFVIPGLWDMHVHPDDPEIWELEPSEADKSLFLPLFVLRGVTTVRDMGGDFALIQRWRARIARGELRGPRIFAAGPLVDGPRPMWPGSVACADADAGRKAVRELKQQGVDFIKVYSLLPRDAFFAIAEECRRTGIAFAGHVPDLVTPAEGAEAGMRSQEHLLGIERYLADGDKVKAAVAALAADATRAQRRTASIDAMLAHQDPERRERLLAQFVSRGTFHCTTLIQRERNAWFTPDRDVVRGQLPYVAGYVRRWWSPELNIHLRHRSPELVDTDRKLYLAARTLAGVMHKAGVRLMTGSDMGGNVHLFPGFSLHDEMVTLTQAGLTPMDAIVAATRNPAECMGVLADVGTLEVGKRADLVLLDADPLADIHNTQAIAAVVQGGELLDRDRLAREMQALAAACAATR